MRSWVRSHTNRVALDQVDHERLGFDAAWLAIVTAVGHLRCGEALQPHSDAAHAERIAVSDAGAADQALASGHRRGQDSRQEIPPSAAPTAVMACCAQA